MNKLYTKIYGWMFIGLIVTFLTGYYVSQNPNMLYNIFSTGTYILLVIIEIVVAVFLTAKIRNMNIITAKTLYILYSILTGLTFSSIFIAYKVESILYVFLIAALMFAVMSVIGNISKINILKIQSILFMGLIGIIIASIINIFINSYVFDLTLVIVGIVIFTLYIAYDTKKIKYIAESLEEDKASIICAFQLYLDFINIFIDLMRLFGKRRD